MRCDATYLPPSLLTYLSTYLSTYPPSNLPTNIQTHLSTFPVTYLPTYARTHTYTHTYNLPNYIPTYQYIHTFIRIVPIVPHPTFSDSNWSSFQCELKSVPVRFGTHWNLFRSVSVPIEVRFSIFVSPFRCRDTLYKNSFFPQTITSIRDWNSLTDSLHSAAEGAEVFVAKFTYLVRARDYSVCEVF